MFAAGAGHVETARVLLDAGADVNAKLKATPEFLEQVRVLAFVLVSLPFLPLLFFINIKTPPPLQFLRFPSPLTTY